MNSSWQYPVYLIPHGVGYVSLVEPEVQEPPVHLLAVFTEAQAAEDLMSQFGVQGTPRALNNDREFCWLLQSLRAPVTQVAFDPKPTDEAVNPSWLVSVQELLDDHLSADYSPWNYPVYLIEQETGFSCIDGQTSDGRSLMALEIFTTQEKAEAYLRDVGQTGAIRTLTDMDETRAFFETIVSEITAVALDPIVTDGRGTAEHCFAVETLLAKYLVRHK